MIKLKKINKKIKDEFKAKIKIKTMFWDVRGYIRPVD